MLQRAISGQRVLAAVVGPAGIGKTRLVTETVQRAQERDVDVLYTYCESHTVDVAFGVMARLLRDALQLRGLEPGSARQRVRELLPAANLQDLLLLDDLLGIAQPNAEAPTFDPQTRRRRLTAVVATVQLARTRPVLIVVEDAHWIDEASDSMLADLVTVDPSSPAMVLFTYRPEYRGMLREVAGTREITLGPLSDAQIAALVTDLVGSAPSVADISRVIRERASGNPFFAEEIVRDLADRGVLVGDRGQYTCTTDIGEIHVPPTLQATLAARIDRLSPAAKQSLCAAAVIGLRFAWNLLEVLRVSPALDELIGAELIDQVGFGAQSEYAFRHPLIRTVAYESQLSSDRAQLHRRLVAGIEAQHPELLDQNAALIAEHLEAAGDIRAAYDWHMRAGDWAINRDVAAARASWERATRIADQLPADEPDSLAMRIAPRTLFCGCAHRFRTDVEAGRFDELKELCIASGDMTSLFVAMLGLVTNHVHRGRVRQGSQLAADVTAEIHAIDSEFTTGSAIPGNDFDDRNSTWRAALRRSQRAIEPTPGESRASASAKSALAFGLCQRAKVRYWVGRPGWREDLDQGLTMARDAGPVAQSRVVSYAYLPAIPAGVLEADDRSIAAIEDAVGLAELAGDVSAVDLARTTLAVALVHHRGRSEQARGHQLLIGMGEAVLRHAGIAAEIPIASMFLTRGSDQHGDPAVSVPLLRGAIDRLVAAGQFTTWGAVATGLLVQTLIGRGTVEDLAEAKAAIARLADAPSDGALAVRDIWLLRLETLTAQAECPSQAYWLLRDRYRDMAKSLAFDGHIRWAEALP
jgi:hypothetical protein